jgi:protein SCO1
MKPFALLLLLACSAVFAAGQTPQRFEQRIGERLPLAARLVDETGKSVPLGGSFGGRPVLLIFGYYKCPQLCSVLARNAIDLLRELQPTVGRDFDVVYLSIDPTDGPAEARIERNSAARSYGRGDDLAGWHYLTGSEADVRPVAAAAGFGYRYDSATRQYLHPTGFLVVTPTGVISRYFLGIDFPSSDVAAAIRRAGEGKMGEPVFDLVLECFRGDGITGKYARWAWRALQGGVVLTLLAVFGGIGWMLHEEFGRRGRREAPL